MKQSENIYIKKLALNKYKETKKKEIICFLVVKVIRKIQYSSTRHYICVLSITFHSLYLNSWYYCTSRCKAKHCISSKALPYTFTADKIFQSKINHFLITDTTSQLKALHLNTIQSTPLQPQIFCFNQKQYLTSPLQTIPFNPWHYISTTDIISHP